ncbi:MAG: cardiolipin synthase ClsB [Elusimicrobia bacterium]|nr:cardiolipin synthase ClsB [Elusimicrobiota bacterium]
MEWQHVLRKYLRRRPPGSGDFTRDLDKYVPGNRLALLNSGQEAFAAMREAVTAARKTVHLETYIFANDETGRDFAGRLMERARQGVSVRLIFDSAGSMGLDPLLLTQMRNAGVRILEYHPLAPWRPNWAWRRRDHRKILVADGRVAFTGGMNVSRDHLQVEEGGHGWNDAHLRLEGPAAHELDRLFREVWFKETRQGFPLAGSPEAHPVNSLVWVAANQEFLHRHRIRRAYLDALRAARREVCIANAYFIPDRGIRKALAAAVRRGVAVRILVQGCSDHPAVWRAGRHTYDELLRRGVRLFEWQGAVMHCKTAVIDGVWCAIGSYNLDHGSLRHNLEVSLQILDCGLAARMKARFEADLARARELTLPQWRRRLWLDKLREEFWYLFRYFF